MDTEVIKKRSDVDRIAVYLTPDEALVLDAFLHRGEAAGDNYGTIEDQAELRVLWDLAALLESSLVAPVKADLEHASVGWNIVEAVHRGPRWPRAQRARPAYGRLRLLVLALAFVGLTGCAELPSIVGPSQPPRLTELGVPEADSLPPLQAAALADGAVTRAEYAQGFAAFARCAADQGNPLDVMGIDPSTGLVSYGTTALLGVPGEPAGTPQGMCYEETFSWIELVFQVSDAGVLEKGFAAQDALYAAEGAACLARNGIDAPSEVDTSTPQGLDWFGRYTALASRQKC